MSYRDRSYSDSYDDRDNRKYENKVYVGDLPADASENEIEQAFRYYGQVNSVWVARNPPGFAFVEFSDRKHAQDAVRDMDGRMLCGARVRVEHSTGKSNKKSFMRGGGGGRRGGGPRRGGYGSNDRCYECGDYGHYASECRRRRGGGGASGGGRRSSGGYSGSRRYSRSRSRSREQRSYSRSRSRSSRSEPL